MLMKADYSKCQHLRRAVRNLRGVVEGAGEGLSFIGLQLYCSGTISKAHVLSDSSKTTYINQARNLCKFIAIGMFFPIACMSCNQITAYALHGHEA